MGVIFFFSAQPVLPGFELDTLDFVFKKIAHMFVFAVLYFLIHRGLVLDQGLTKGRWWQALVFCLLYAISDELHQSFSPNRHPSLRDVGFDMIGASSVFLWMYRFV
jgi:VanZ family protein